MKSTNIDKINFAEYSEEELKQLLNKTSNSLKHKQRMKNCKQELQSVLQKYKISIEDASKLLQGNKTSRKPKAKSAKKAVQKKYHDGAKKQFWAGRGRAPIWVNAICEQKGISLEEFKASATFKL